MNKTNERYKIGAKIAALTCLPFGLLFSLIVLVLSLSRPFDLFLAISAGKIFWFPGSLLILIAFTYLTWKGGKRIVENLDLKKSNLDTSLDFVQYVNLRLFIFIAVLWLIGGLLLSERNINITFILIGLGLTFLTYVFSTFFTMLTIGLLTTYLIKRQLN